MNDQYRDDCQNYKQAEVAIDYVRACYVLCVSLYRIIAESVAPTNYAEGLTPSPSPTTPKHTRTPASNQQWRG